MFQQTFQLRVPDYVLQRFSNDEMVTMEKVIEHAARAIEKFVETSRFDHH
jgi:PTH1 family peptidyl-tRNA hydrolase